MMSYCRCHNQVSDGEGKQFYSFIERNVYDVILLLIVNFVLPRQVLCLLCRRGARQYVVG